MSGCTQSSDLRARRRRLIAEARHLEYFLYRIHEFFWYAQEGGKLRILSCVNDPGRICLLAGVGLGVMPLEDYYRFLAAQQQPAPQPASVPQPVRVKPRDGIASAVAPGTAGWEDDYEARKAARRRTLLRLVAFALSLVGIGYYILMDLLHPTGVTP